MKTKFTSRDAARWKKIAAICFEDGVKRAKLQDKIEELQAELGNVITRIEMNQATVKMDTGYTTDDLIERVVEVTDKVDKNGYPIKSVKWVLKYPDTFVPPMIDDVEVQCSEPEQVTDLQVDNSDPFQN